MTPASESRETLPALPPLSPATWRGDLGGALGDLGTLLPFLVGFVVVAGVQPSSILLAFGLSLVIVGWRFGVPMPVQPMKAVGAAALAHTVTGTNDLPAVLALAALMTGVFWLVAAWSGLARWLARHVSRDVIHGVVLGLGIALIVAGLRRIEGDAVLGSASVVLALVLLGRGGWLTMPVLMSIGMAVGWWRQPGLMQALAETPWTLALPAPQWGAFNQPGVWLAAIGLAAAQIPLTFGNAILGIVAETRRLFPAVAVDESRMARGTGFMNLLAGGLGAPPMCFGAGGMAAQVACGARTGRAPIFLGTVLLLAGLFASGQLAALLGLLPAGTVGAMLFVAGFSLTIGTAGSSRDKEARAVLLTTAAVSVWNAGVGVVVGVLLEVGLKSKWLRI
ncbi:molybdate transporter family protein [Hydrogenophaga sp.]|uniref:putative sulfate/molybdate transporter n=1 Tax=Hydrogenophaga sp. TaxID=1904254 RepID=UPI002731AED0|nr:molybdate transporter family protein [Hydrogenophaga sp.]MDP1686688.1 molybdate transporter family protein [Hydrogenophaga sp.]